MISQEVDGVRSLDESNREQIFLFGVATEALDFWTGTLFLIDITNDPSYSSRCFKGVLTVGWFHFTDFEAHRFSFCPSA